MKVAPGKRGPIQVKYAQDVESSAWKEVMQRNQEYLAYGRANSPVYGALPGGITVRYTVNAAGDLTLLETKTSRTYTRNQRKFFEDSIRATVKKHPLPPGLLEETGGTSLTEELVITIY
ncbi:MAG: hypothetical protein AB1705_12975 [Verrucomicrobiota bacterium]